MSQRAPSNFSIRGYPDLSVTEVWRNIENLTISAFVYGYGEIVYNDTGKCFRDPDLTCGWDLLCNGPNLI